MAAIAVPASVDRSAAVLAWYARAYRRTWRGTVAIAFLNPVFFLLSVGVLLGGIIDDARPDLGGLTYLEFVAPGLLAASAMQIGAGEGSFPVMAGVRWVKTYYAVIATPVRVHELFTGVLAWAAARLAVSASIFTAIAAAFGAFRSPLAALAPLAAVLCGLAFAAPLAALSARLESSQGLTGVFRFVILPLFLLSGTFFPVDRLPDWLEPLAWATPLWHGASLCRDLASGSAALGPSLGHAAVLLAFVVGGAVLATVLLRRRLLT